MKTPTMNNIVVLGSGVLGGQIAWHSAFHGKQVVVYDISEQALSRCKDTYLTYIDIYKHDLNATNEQIAATNNRLSFTTELAKAVANADLVIEAVPENPAIKTNLYHQLAGLLPAHTIIATNSSTLLASQFAQSTGRPKQYAALHFANLIWKLNLAEIMAHPDTSDETIKQLYQFALDINQVPIPVRGEQNGYVLNSWLVPLFNAAQTLVTNNIASAEDIDRTYMIANQSALGPCAMMDIIGMTTCFNIMSYWGEKNNDAQMLANAAYVKTHFIEQDFLGLQTGQGHYSYPNPRFSMDNFLAIPKPDEVELFIAKMR